MKAEEKLKMLMDSGEFEFIKEIPEDDLWRLCFAFAFISGDVKEMELPSVQQKQKEAEWVLLDDCSNAGYYCSNCQKKVVREGWSKTVKEIKYCPNCGFRMKGGIKKI